jgi:hypothetical protein
MSIEMRKFGGFSRVNACLMLQGDYYSYVGLDLPEGLDFNEGGYLVEYLDLGSNHDNHSGHITWSPSIVFDNYYMELPDSCRGMRRVDYRFDSGLRREVEDMKGIVAYLLERLYRDMDKAGHDRARTIALSMDYLETGIMAAVKSEDIKSD